MGRQWMLLLLVTGITGYASAQKGDNQVRLLVEAGIPTEEYRAGPGADEYRTGPGVYAKFLYGVGRSGQLSFTAGFTRFENRTFQSLAVRAIPVLLGYQFNIRNFYLEPQVGYGVLSGYDYDYIDRRWVRYSAGAAYFSLGGGYEYKRWDAGMRFQGGHAVDDLPLSFHSRYLYFVGVHVGYALWRNPSRTEPSRTPGP